MSIVDRFRRGAKAFASEETPVETAQSEPVNAFPNMLTNADLVASALRVPVFARSIDIMSSLVAQLITSPGALHVIGPDGNAMDRESRRIKKILELMTGIGEDFWQETAAGFMLYGNAFTYPVGKDFDRIPRTLVRMDPSSVTVEWVNLNSAMLGGQYRYGLKPSNTGLTDADRKWYPEPQLLISRWNRLPRNGSIGSFALPGSNSGALSDSPLSGLRDTIEIARRSDQWLSLLFDPKRGSAGKQDSFISSPIEMTDADYKRQAKHVRESDRLGLPIMVGNGAQVGSVGNTQRQEFVVNLNEKVRQDIAVVYGVSAPLLQQAGEGWGSSLSQLSRFAYRFGLSPIINKLMRPYNDGILLRGEKFYVFPQEFIRGDANDMLRLSKAYEGIATDKERRNALGLPPEPEDRFVDDEPSQSEEDSSLGRENRPSRETDREQAE